MNGPVRVTRRSFLVGLELSLGGLALGIFPRFAGADEPSRRAGPGPRPSSETVEQSAGGLNPNVLVHIAVDGTTTI